MTKLKSPCLNLLLVILVAGLFSFFVTPAFAGGVWAKGCSADGTLSGIWCSMSTEFRFIPKALVIFAYAGGVILAFMGLLQLKKYGDDPSQTPLRDVIMKFVLAILLISLPLAMQIVVKTVTGKGITDQNVQDTTVLRPRSARGSALGL